MNFTTYSWVMVSDVDQNAITSIRTEFYLSESNTELRGGTWSVTPPPWQQGKYYWYKMITTFSDPDKEPVETKPVCVTGVGSPGKGIVSLTPEYSINKDKNTPPSSNWSQKPGIWVYGTYLWTRIKVVYTDNTIEYTKPVCDTSWEGISGIEIGGKNLLTNTSSMIAYKASESNWIYGNWGTVQTNTVDKATDSIHIVTPGSGTINSGIVFSTKNIQYVQNEYYTFSVAIRGTFDATVPFIAQIHYTNTSGQDTYDTNSKVSWVDDGDGINDGINSFRFQRRFLTFSVPKDFDETVNKLQVVISSQKMDVLICRPQLEKGNKPTDWKRAEEDVQSQITSVVNSISGVSSVVDKINGQITNKIWNTDVNNAINNYDGTTIKSIRENISQQEQTLNGFKQDVKDLQTTVETKADGSTVETLSQKVSSTEQSLNGFKQTVQNNYTTTEDLSKNYALKSYAEQLANRIYWLVESNSSSTSLTLTPEALQAITNQFIIKSPNGKYTIIENGIFSGEALKSNNYSAPTTTTGGYAASGTFYNLLDGSITSKNFVVDSSGNVKLKGTVYATDGSFTGNIIANSLTLGSGVSIDGSKISNLSYNQLTNKPNLSIYIQKDGTIGSNPSQGATGFKVSSSGLLQASNAVIYGTVYASAGNIGGCTISNGLLQVPAARITGYLSANQIGAGIITVDKITSNNLQGLNGWINLNKGTFDYGDGKLKWDGSNLSINGSGTFSGAVYASSGSFTGSVYASSGKFTGDITANTIIATQSGKIACWDINSSSIYNGNSSFGNANGMYFGTSGLSIGSAFQVNKTGALISTNANITGNITAKSITAYQTYGISFAKCDQNGNPTSTYLPNDNILFGYSYPNAPGYYEEWDKYSYHRMVVLQSPKYESKRAYIKLITRKNTDGGLLGSNITLGADLITTDGSLWVGFDDYGEKSGGELYAGYVNAESIETTKITFLYPNPSMDRIELRTAGPMPEQSFTFVGYDNSGKAKYFNTVMSDIGTMICNQGYTANNITENFQNKILWSGGHWPDNSQTCTFSQTVRSQPHGIIVVFSYYNGGPKNEQWQSFFIAKEEINQHNGQGYLFQLNHMNGTYPAIKYMYIYNEKIVGHANNKTTISGSHGSYNNNRFVLRFVIGC